MFKFDRLNEINSFAARVRYCDQNLTRMKAGSSRRVYDLGDGQVLKLALNAKGLAQNNVESDGGFAIMYPDELNAPLNWSENGHWVTAKKLEPVKKKDVEDFYGVSWADLTKYFLLSAKYILNNNSLYPDPPESDDLIKNERILDLNRMLMDSDILASDFLQITAFGHEKETGLIKLMDFGLNKGVFFEHYQKPTREYGYDY